MPSPRLLFSSLLAPSLHPTEMSSSSSGCKRGRGHQWWEGKSRGGQREEADGLKKQKGAYREHKVKIRDSAGMWRIAPGRGGRGSRAG
jgi:hypothetical protein